MGFLHQAYMHPIAAILSILYLLIMLILLVSSSKEKDIEGLFISIVSLLISPLVISFIFVIARILSVII